MDCVPSGGGRLGGSFHLGQLADSADADVARVEILDRLLEENHRRAATQAEAPPPVDTDDEAADD